MIGVLAVLALAFFFLWWETTGQVWEQSQRDEASKADVILVLGAAEYRGKPSPVLRARLDHVLELYRQGLSALVLTTGGAGGDPVHTEAEVSRKYLTENGVPAESVLVETQGSSTVESVAAATEIMRRAGLRSAVIVSDGYHVYRVKKMLESKGIRSFASPRKDPDRPRWQEWWLCARQAGGYLLWRAGVPV
jgi:vancomycin permeability regulator SanA